MYYPLLEKNNKITILGEGHLLEKQAINNPDNQLPSINNLGAPQWNYVDILVRDSIAYCLTNWWDFAEVYDFTNPKEPIKIFGSQSGSFGHFGGYTAMAFYGDYICFVNQYNLTLCDLSQPAKLTIRRSFGLNFNYSYISNLRIKNNIGFITSYNGRYNSDLEESEYNGSLTLINFASIKNSIIAEYQNDKFVRDVSVQGNYAYLMDSNWGDYERSGFEIIDVSNPANPVLISEWQGECITDSLKIINNHLFLTTDKGLWVFDVSDPSNPQKVGQYNEKMKMKSIFCDGNLLYATFDNGLIIFDISDPENVKKVGKKRIFFEGNGGFTKLVLENSFVYALRQTEYEGREIFVFDVSDPAHPKKLYPSGIKFGHEVMMYLLWTTIVVGILVAIITAIVVPIVVVRKRRKKRSIESKEKIKEALDKSTSQEELIAESAPIK